MKKLALSALTILLVLTMATAASAGQKFRWSANSPEGYPDYEAAMWVKRYVEEHTDGEITFEVYPANQLGDWLQVFDEIIMGTIDFCTTSVPDSYDPRIAACTLPYLTSNYNEIRSVFRPGGYYDTTLQGIYADLGVKYFGIYCDGYCGVGVQVPLTNAHETNKPKGALIRVPPVSAYQWTMERLGFRTSTIPYTDTFTSLQTGIVQGWIGGPVSQHYGQWTDVENHYYNYDVWQEARHYIGSLKTWQSLKPEHQKIIEEAIQIAAARSIDLAEQYDKEYLDKLSAKEGFTVVRITDEERAAMADDVHKNIWPGRLADQYGQEFLDNLLKDMKENVAGFEK
ncbi:MAG: TRAP transporter substrate-binding protein DctP [Planctomycetaceae bacterium]|nr:TRAP transporter substrate-binding protein DctP [Planctomycetaceae bacterium]